MRRAWDAWVRRTARLEDPRPLALVRIAVAGVIGADLLRVGQRGLVPVLFATPAGQGLSAAPADAAWIDEVPDGGLAAWMVTIAAMACSALGIATRPAMLIGTLAYAQLGHLYPPGDRAIDRLLRTVLLILLFSGSHSRLSLTGRRVDRIRAWPADTLRVLLVVVYFTSGVGKLYAQPAWLATSGVPVLYRVMTDPLAGHLDPVGAMAWWGPLRVLGWLTIVLELSAPLVLTRWARWWAIGGIMMHLGIAFTMDLGMFSWGMLALYPVVLAKPDDGQ